MKKWTLPAAAAVLLAMAWSHWPAAAQRAPQPATAGDMITFDQYRDFRARDLQQRQERLARQLADSGLSGAEKASIERRKAYYDRLAAMPAEARDHSIASGSTRSTAITTASSIRRNGPRGARSSEKSIVSNPPNAPGRPTSGLDRTAAAGSADRMDDPATLRSSATSELTLVAVGF